MNNFVIIPEKISANFINIITNKLEKFKPIFIRKVRLNRNDLNNN